MWACLGTVREAEGGGVVGFVGTDFEVEGNRGENGDFPFISRPNWSNLTFV